MGNAVGITRDDLSATALRRAAARSRDGRGVVSFAGAGAGGCLSHGRRGGGGMDRQTLRDWVHRYNADGIAGLADRQREGRPPALNAAQMQALRELVMSGPLPSQDGVVRWRCIDLRDQIAKRYEVEVHTRTVGKLLRRLGMRRLQPRPYHPKKDADAQEAFKKNFADLVAGVLPPEAADKPIEIWFEDEARVGQQDTLSYIWPRADRVRRGCVTTAMILSGCSVPSVPIVPSVLPHHARRQQRSHGRPSRRDQHAGRAWRHAVLICDGAGWHQHSTRMPLPANTITQRKWATVKT